MGQYEEDIRLSRSTIPNDHLKTENSVLTIKIPPTSQNEGSEISEIDLSNTHKTKKNQRSSTQ